MVNKLGWELLSLYSLGNVDAAALGFPFGELRWRMIAASASAIYFWENVEE